LIVGYFTFNPDRRQPIDSELNFINAPNIYKPQFISPLCFEL